MHEVSEIEKKKVKETKDRLYQDWGKIKPTMAVSSGGLHPGQVPFLMKHWGKDIVIQAGEGCHGHPLGTGGGARALRQSINATMEKKSLKEYSKNHVELREALVKWKKK